MSRPFSAALLGLSVLLAACGGAPFTMADDTARGSVAAGDDAASEADGGPAGGDDASGSGSDAGGSSTDGSSGAASDSATGDAAGSDSEPESDAGPMLCGSQYCGGAAPVCCAFVGPAAAAYACEAACLAKQSPVCRTDADCPARDCTAQTCGEAGDFLFCGLHTGCTAK